MKFTSIKEEFFRLCSFDNELLHNQKEKRPYLLIIKLKYKQQNYDFAIPFRSNISNYIPKEQYFSLPPRFTTNQNKIHGLHYIKMFPIQKQYLKQYVINKDSYHDLIKDIINKNIKQIIQESQKYINDYECGIKVEYATNIEGIFEALTNPKRVSEDGTGSHRPCDKSHNLE